MDEVGFRSNLGSWQRYPIAGVLVAGSTGEAPFLDEEELLQLVEWAREECGDLLVLAGTGAESTRSAVRLAVAAAASGADAVLVRPPSYYRDAMTPQALQAHFETLADESPVPVLLYNMPRYVPVELAPEVVRQLVGHQNVAGIKDSSGDIKLLGALAEACEGQATLLVGSGAALYAGLELGASGGILAVGLLAPEAACRSFDAWQAGDFATAGRLQERLGSLHKRVVSGFGVPGIKYALDVLGLAGGAPRFPLLALPERDRRPVEEALSASGLMRGTDDVR